MLENSEFYEAMKAFEKNINNVTRIRQGTQGFNKEPKENWEKRCYYTDGNTNEAFKIFLFGYSYGKTM